MGFYSLSKDKRKEFVDKMRADIKSDLDKGISPNIDMYVSDPDTYVRKNSYQILARLYKESEEYKEKVLALIDELQTDKNVLKRQTAVYTLCEIGIFDAEKILNRLEKVLTDEHHRVRNAVTGGLKRMTEKNPVPALKFAEKYIHHENPLVRIEIIHGIELLGRKNPEKILPLLKEIQDDSDKKVRKILIHVLGQISYKKGCLEKVVTDLMKWKNEELVKEALDEIMRVHEKYPFSDKTPKEAREYILKQLS
ncbi:MAG: HEAT repeat domain-containing protein [Candidatus Hodarchaeales archaeon]